MTLWESWEKTEFMFYSTVGGNCVQSVHYNISTRQVAAFFFPEEHEDINNSENWQKQGKQQ